MPTLPYVTESDADDEVQAIYKQIKESFGAGSVPNVYQVLGNNPRVLKAAIENRRSIMEQGQLDPMLKEWLAWSSVTQSNNVFGIRIHTARLKKLGVTNAQILEALAVLQYFSGISTLINGLAMDDDVNEDVLTYLAED
ncbi:MAG TPA: carboxymuconolactone decarboxylase family protein [Nitrolancea sp.]|nr:carboxymuconolactone decarboxylase family protein [Nitrolancea sp.]